MAGATKNNILKGDNYYFGAPLRKAFTRKVKKYLDVTDEDLKRAEQLKEKRKDGVEDNDE
jgi:membrane protein DedA with SNARE-associated domain